MALKVWLPLTGTLENKGISDINLTSTAFTIDNNGKIGKCIKTTDSAGINLGYDGNQINTGDLSFGGWFKISEAEVSPILSNGNYTSTIKAATSNLLGNDSYGGIGLIWNTNNIYNSTFSSMNAFATIRTGSVNQSTSSTTIEFDKWIHLFLTFQKSTGILSFYKNGVLIGNKTFSNFSDAVSRNLTLNYKAVYGGNALSFYLPYCVNDIRIYDHCLSPLEVKEISQGLILHYKLDSNIIEATTNLITTEDCLSSTCYNGATGKYSYGTTTDMYKEVTIFDGHKGTKVYMGTNGNSAFPYVYISNMYTSDGTNSPAYKTLSFDYYTNIGTSIRPYKLGSGSGTATYRISNSSGISTGTGTDAVSIPVLQNEWNHIEITFHGTTEADAQWGYIQNYPTHTSDTSNFWFFSNMQLETKDHATGYVGIGKSRNIGYIVDSSGYGNNGIQNNIVISPDSSRYNYSVAFNGSNSYIKIPDNNWLTQGMETITINFWAKAATWPANGGRLISCTQTGGFNLEGGNSGYWRFSVHVYTNAEKTSTAYKYDSKEIQISALTPNNWNMITLVYDTTGTKTYINGQLHHTYVNTSYGIHFNTSARLFLGCEANTANPTSPYFNGQMSDFRIYATTLSAEDIATLYHTPAQIDNLGGIHGFEFEEKQGNSFATELLGNYNSTSANWDSQNNQFTIVSPKGTGSRYGLVIKNANSRRLIPWGYTYRLTFDIYVPITTNFNVDYNNYSNDSSVSLSGNDNDDTSKRLSASFTVNANTWTTVTLGSSNTSESKNPNHVTLYDQTNFGIKTDTATESVTWYLKNPQWYLVDTNEATNYQVYQNGIFKNNFIKQDDTKNFASFRNKEKAIWGTNIIEK